MTLGQNERSAWKAPFQVLQASRAPLVQVKEGQSTRPQYWLHITQQTVSGYVFRHCHCHYHYLRLRCAVFILVPVHAHTVTVSNILRLSKFETQLSTIFVRRVCNWRASVSVRVFPKKSFFGFFLSIPLAGAEKVSAVIS